MEGKEKGWIRQRIRISIQILGQIRIRIKRTLNKIGASELALPGLFHSNYRGSLYTVQPALYPLLGYNYRLWFLVCCMCGSSEYNNSCQVNTWLHTAPPSTYTSPINLLLNSTMHFPIMMLHSRVVRFLDFGPTRVFIYGL